MAALIKPYEISVWEDILVTNGDNSYYDEKKIMVIGSNEMTGPNRVYEPVLKQNMNGEVSLTFSLKHKYFDYVSQKEIINPFESFLVNERKIKLHYDGKWYDFIIKNHEESSDEYTWTYTAVDAAVLELSKTGYNIEFDVELNNNQGTARELAEKTLENTDWQVRKCEVGRQTVEEAIYFATLVPNGLNILNTDDPEESYDGTTNIYLFYSYVANGEGKYVQFIKQDTSHLDDKNNIIATNYRILDELKYKDGEFKLGNTTVITVNELETAHHAYRLVYKQKTTYDPVMKRTVDIFSIGDEKEAAYRYTDSDYTTSDVVISYVTNGNNFDVNSEGSLQGWRTDTESDPVYVPCDASMTVVQSGVDYYEWKNNTFQKVINPSGNPYEQGYFITENYSNIELTTYPLISSKTRLIDLLDYTEVEGYLEARFGGIYHDRKNVILNTGIMNNASLLGSISLGQKFVLRWRAGSTSEKHGNLNEFNGLGAIVAKYTTEKADDGRWVNKISENGIILDFTQSTPNILNNIITGGELQEEDTIYVIDGVVQEPSTKYVYKVGNIEYVWRDIPIYAACDETMIYTDPSMVYYQKIGDEYEKVQNPSGSPYAQHYYYLDKTIHKYVVKDDKFIDYYYLTAEATQAVSNKDLTDADTNIGIFICLREGNNHDWYYIQDIQLTKFFEDTNELPIVIGNVPTAKAITTEHYYIKPLDGTVAEDITTYIDIDAFAKGIGVSPADIKPLYNKDSEKILTISESHSNCFNILQSIAETFEAWLNIEIEHDENGKIVIENGQPQKFVSFKEFAGNDNYAGFKYGINLNSIQRTVESEEIVSKLIVDQTQSDYNDAGFVSIQSAKSNPNGESYILNFDYYLNQGLIKDIDSFNSDIGNFNETVFGYNQTLGKKEFKKRNLENSLIQIGSKRNFYTELVNSAKGLINEGLDDFQKATGWDYYEYIKIYNGTVGDIYVKTKDIKIDTGKTYYKQEIIDSKINYVVVSSPSIEELNIYYEKVADFLDNEQIVDAISKIYANSSIVNNYQGLLNTVGIEYKDIRKQLYGNETYTFTVAVVPGEHKNTLKIYINDYIVPFSFDILHDIGEGPQVEYHEETTVSIKSFEFDIDEPIVVEGYFLGNFACPTGYQVYDANNNPINIIEVDPTAIQKFKIVPEVAAGGLVDEIKAIQKEKDEYTSTFFNKYSRFIQEGTWSSTEYIDSELYYLDALQISNTSSQPKVSYSIEVVEISEIEGYENYNFTVGDKTWVEDEEFFGWNSETNGPAREEVIVSEVEWHLDEPQNNVVTVQNYKTQFEDLFQRISATVQSVQYNEATYAKISSFVDANGTIREDVLLASLDRIKGRKYSLTTDGSVSVDGDMIYIRNLTNAANRVILNSEGIRISDDGGVTWATAIDGKGINAGLIYTGSLNTKEVVIGDRDNPSFRWDQYGISAFKQNQDETYDLTTYVRFDQYGLYGIKQGDSFRASSIDDVENNAQFGVTWRGFFIRNSYEDGGRVSITSDDDFQVIDGNDTTRIKIGSLYVDEHGRHYGINIRNAIGNNVFITNDDGNITITGTLNATDGEFSGHVRVGIENPYIDIDGTNAWLQSSNYSSQIGWRIDSLGDAYFSNITARGAIRTAVFEYSEIQAVGGIFLFRPSSLIKEARIASNNTDLILKVEKPLLFARIVYNIVENPDPSDNPHLNGWYEKNNYGYVLTEDIIVESEKTYYARNTTNEDSWCKVSNYITDGVASDPSIQNILLTNGLTHIYKVINVNINNSEITLQDAAKMVQGPNPVTTLSELKGGALIDMGRENNSSNYGIGVNSSDNTVNLPRRAISLFETTIIPNALDEIRVKYNYRGILGTLPPIEDMQGTVDASIYNYMQNTQGIYTDNMYIGDANQYLIFYTEGNKKKLKIRAESLEFGSPEGYIDVSDGNIDVIITSDKGNIFKDDTTTVNLTCTVYQYGEDITPNSGFQWYKDGIELTGQTSRTLSNISTATFETTTVYTCKVTIN